MKIDNLSGSELALCFGTSNASISQFKKAGMPTKGGKFNLPACIQWRVSRAGGKVEDKAPDGDAWLAEFRKQKAMTARLQRLKMKGSLVDAESAEAVIREAVGAAKTALLAIPRKMAGRICGLDPREIEAQLADEIREILMRLASRKIPREIQDAIEIEAAEEDPDETPKRRARSVATTGKADRQRVGGKASRPGRNDKRGSRRVAK